MNTDFYRIKRLPPYIFEEVNRLKAAARARGEDIIDFGMGNPDMATPDYIVDKLCETARDPRAQFTISQDPSLLLTRRWQFAQGQLTSLGRSAAR